MRVHLNDLVAATGICRAVIRTSGGVLAALIFMTYPHFSAFKMDAMIHGACALCLSPFACALVLFMIGAFHNGF